MPEGPIGKRANEVSDEEVRRILNLPDDEVLRLLKGALVAGIKVVAGGLLAVSPEGASHGPPFDMSVSRALEGGTAEGDVVLERAIQVIGDRDEALRWMGTPVRALNYATPISLLGNSSGQERVLTVLTQLEHGVL
jgi:hypothetical protein